MDVEHGHISEATRPCAEVVGRFRGVGELDIAGLKRLNERDEQLSLWADDFIAIVSSTLLQCRLHSIHIVLNYPDPSVLTGTDTTELQSSNARIIGQRPCA